MVNEKSIVVEARKLTKIYSDVPVVHEVDFQISRGECFGILGPNGAGKSTTMRMMYGSTQLTSGELFVLGWDVNTNSREIKTYIGVVPQDDGLDPDFSVLENLAVFARYHRISPNLIYSKAMELLRFMKLDAYYDRTVATLSGGMRRRLAIARSLINDPKLIFLDEPTSGLDPQARLWVWDKLSILKNEGASLILTTHYMEEAEKVCDRLAIMDKGRIISVGKPRDLINEHIGREVVEFKVESIDLAYTIKRIQERTFDYQVLGDRIKMYIPENKDGRAAISFINSNNITVRKAALDDVFLKLTGHELRDEKSDD